MSLLNPFEYVSKDKDQESYIEELIKKIESCAETIIINKLKEGNVTFNDIKSQITADLFPFVYDLTGRKPIILPVILDIKR